MSTQYVKIGSSLALSSSDSWDGDLWTPPADLDAYLIRVYEYYRGKGFTCSLLSKLFNFLSFTWVACLILFALAFFDITEFSWTLRAAPPEGLLFYVVGVILLAIWLGLLGYSLLHVRGLFEMRRFFSGQLDLAEDAIPSALWTDVVDRLVSVPGLCRTGDLTHLKVAQRIMRKENYLIALINRDVLALYLPFFSNSRVVTKSLEWSLHLSLFRVLFSHSQLIENHHDVLENPALRKRLVKRVKQQFMLVGVLSLLLAPVVFLLLVTFFVLRYGEELRNKPHRLGLHGWSRYAHWKFREFNELPHELEDRLNRAVAPAAAYLDQFTSPSTILVCRFGLFVFGSLVIGILVGSFFQPDILEDDLFLARSGLWWLAVCGSALAMCRAFLPEDNFVLQPEQYFEEAAAHTHYTPERWSGCRSPLVRAEFSGLFPYQVQVLLVECVSVLFVPFIFLFSLPACTGDIVAFVFENTSETEEVGDICTFANFDFQKHGNPLYGSVICAPELQQSRDGKMEQSFLTFSTRNPNWQPEEEGRKMMENLAVYGSVLSTEAAQQTPLGPQASKDEMFDSLFQMSPTQLAQIQRDYRTDVLRSPSPPPETFPV